MENTKVWFITGSSRGLGRVLAEEALSRGLRVAATARKVDALQPLVEKYGELVLPLELDVTKPGEAQAAVNATVEKFGRIDVVVNNAGYANTNSVEDFALDDFREQVDTNFYGVVHVSRAALPVLRKQRSGTFLQISSIGGRRGGTPGLSAYQAAKFAVAGFSLVLAAETAPFGVRVVVCEPGGIATDWAGSSMKIHEQQPDYEPTVGATAKRVRGNPDGSRGDPKKMARVLLEVAESPNPPRRLLLGSDALFFGRFADDETRREAEQWAATSVSTDRDGQGDFAQTDVAKFMTRQQ